MPPTSNDRQVSNFNDRVLGFLKVTGDFPRNNTSKFRLALIPAGQYEPELSLASELLEEISSSSSHIDLDSRQFNWDKYDIY